MTKRKIYPYTIYSHNYDRWPGVGRHTVLMIARRIALRMNRRYWDHLGEDCGEAR